MTFLWQTRSIFSKNNVLQIVLLPFDAVWVFLKASNRPNESAVFSQLFAALASKWRFFYTLVGIANKTKKLHLKMQNDISCIYR